MSNDLKIKELQAFFERSLAKSSSTLRKMAIADIKPGVLLPHDAERFGDHEAYDYTHVLPAAAQRSGYRLTIWHQPGKATSIGGSIDHPSSDDIGSLYARVSSGGVVGPFDAGISEGHSQQGLGTAMYEAMLAHAKQRFSVKTVVGDIHSTAAHNLHLRLAAKHGLDYRAEPRQGKSRTDGRFDKKWGKYRYALKSEVNLAKASPDDQGTRDWQGQIGVAQDAIQEKHPRVEDVSGDAPNQIRAKAGNILHAKIPEGPYWEDYSPERTQRDIALHQENNQTRQRIADAGAVNWRARRGEGGPWPEPGGQTLWDNVDSVSKPYERQYARFSGDRNFWGDLWDLLPPVTEPIAKAWPKDDQENTDNANVHAVYEDSMYDKGAVKTAHGGLAVLHAVEDRVHAMQDQWGDDDSTAGQAGQRIRAARLENQSKELGNSASNEVDDIPVPAGSSHPYRGFSDSVNHDHVQDPYQWRAASVALRDAQAKDQEWWKNIWDSLPPLSKAWPKDDQENNANAHANAIAQDHFMDQGAKYEDVSSKAGPQLLARTNQINPYEDDLSSARITYGTNNRIAEAARVNTAMRFLEGPSLPHIGEPAFGLHIGEPAFGSGWDRPDVSGFDYNYSDHRNFALHNDRRWWSNIWDSLNEAVPLTKADSSLPSEPEPEDLPEHLTGHHLFSGKPYGILTAQNPGAGFATAGNNKVLEDRLRQLKLSYIPARGNYGNDEDSYVVYNPTLEQMTTLGHDFGQESVVYGQDGNHQIHYTNGPNEGTYHPTLPGRAINYFRQQPAKYWTEIPGGGGFFNINVDWGTKLPRPSGMKKHFSDHDAIAQDAVQEGHPSAKVLPDKPPQYDPPKFATHQENLLNEIRVNRESADLIDTYHHREPGARSYAVGPYQSGWVKGPLDTQAKRQQQTTEHQFDDEFWSSLGRSVGTVGLKKASLDDPGTKEWQTQVAIQNDAIQEGHPSAKVISQADVRRELDAKRPEDTRESTNPQWGNLWTTAFRPQRVTRAIHALREGPHAQSGASEPADASNMGASPGRSFDTGDVKDTFLDRAFWQSVGSAAGLTKSWPKDDVENRDNTNAHAVMEDSMYDKGAQKKVVAAPGQILPRSTSVDMRNAADTGRVWEAKDRSLEAGLREGFVGPTEPGPMPLIHPHEDRVQNRGWDHPPAYVNAYGDQTPSNETQWWRNLFNISSPMNKASPNDPGTKEWQNQLAIQQDAAMEGHPSAQGIPPEQVRQNVADGAQPVKRPLDRWMDPGQPEKQQRVDAARVANLITAGMTPEAAASDPSLQWVPDSANVPAGPATPREPAFNGEISGTGMHEPENSGWETTHQFHPLASDKFFWESLGRSVGLNKAEPQFQAAFLHRKTGQVVPCGAVHDLSTLPGYSEDWENDQGLWLPDWQAGFSDTQDHFHTRWQAAAKLGIKGHLEGDRYSRGAEDPTVEGQDGMQGPRSRHGGRPWDEKIAKAQPPHPHNQVLSDQLQEQGFKPSTPEQQPKMDIDGLKLGGVDRHGNRTAAGEKTNCLSNTDDTTEATAWEACNRQSDALGFKHHNNPRLIGSAPNFTGLMHVAEHSYDPDDINGPGGPQGPVNHPVSYWDEAGEARTANTDSLQERQYWHDVLQSLPWKNKPLAKAWPRNEAENQHNTNVHAVYEDSMYDKGAWKEEAATPHEPVHQLDQRTWPNDAERHAAIRRTIGVYTPALQARGPIPEEPSDDNLPEWPRQGAQDQTHALNMDKAFWSLLDNEVRQSVGLKKSWPKDNQENTINTHANAIAQDHLMEQGAKYEDMSSYSPSTAKTRSAAAERDAVGKMKQIVPVRAGASDTCRRCGTSYGIDPTQDEFCPDCDADYEDLNTTTSAVFAVDRRKEHARDANTAAMLNSGLITHPGQLREPHIRELAPTEDFWASLGAAVGLDPIKKT